jgi:geranylgeranyl diphosphate synthase, type II
MLKKYIESNARYVDTHLQKVLPGRKTYPACIHDAMHYMVFSGGKRIRPILSIACCEACGAAKDAVILPALAIELIHTYSLIHDDLPCMDDDDMRRGQPTCHKKYGEANAVLAGDALLTYAFEILSRQNVNKQSMRIINQICLAAGSLGMIGGQVVDKISEGNEISLPLLDYINVHKTGKLIMVSCLVGAIAARAGKRNEHAIVKYGEYLGFAFQVVDDIIDNDGYLRFMSRKEAFTRARELIMNAKESVSSFGSKALILNKIADFVLERGVKGYEGK